MVPGFFSKLLDNCRAIAARPMLPVQLDFLEDKQGIRREPAMGSANYPVAMDRFDQVVAPVVGNGVVPIGF